MKVVLLTFALVGVLSQDAFAFPSGAPLVQRDVDFFQWIPKGPIDVRSPCPALNASVVHPPPPLPALTPSVLRLANHGILPRNGMNITLTLLIKSCKGPSFTLDPRKEEKD